MKALARFLNSTLGKKVVMSVTGLMLVVFLIEHLIGNFLILDSKKAYNDYADWLLDMKPWVWFAEAGLLLIFIVHVVNGIKLTRLNRSARPERYYEFGLAKHTSRRTPMSSNMIWSGLLLVLFVALHLWSFKFGTHYEAEPGIRDVHRLVVEKYSDLGWVAIYVLFMLVLGLHLVHGIHSAFQTLGIPHRTFLQRLAQGLAVLLAVGFGAIPVIVHFMGDRLA